MVSGHHAEPIDIQRIALGVHQPWAELILRGLKTIELRHSNTVRLERIYLYATKQTADLSAAKIAIREHQLDLERLPRGLIVGSVEIIGSRTARPDDSDAACVPRKLIKDCFAWELANPVPYKEPIPAKFEPYGTWFYPFRRKKLQPRLSGRRKK
jgi:ASCH domain